jgi:transcriptional regulator with XRE-family HTH domain
MTTMFKLVADAAIEPANERGASTTRSATNICVARRLRIRRMSRGISEQELCEKLGIDRADIDAYEAGTKRVSANLLLRIAELLDVRPDYFFRGYTPAELSACLEFFAA